MTIVCLAAPVVAFLLLTAHFYRVDNLLGLGISLLAVLLVFVRRPWAARTMQVLLLLGALEWLRAAIALVQLRSEAGQPFLRLGVILGAVFLLTALSALVVQTKRLKAYFELAGDDRPSASESRPG